MTLYLKKKEYMQNGSVLKTSKSATATIAATVCDLELNVVKAVINRNVLLLLFYKISFVKYTRQRITKENIQ